MEDVFGVQVRNKSIVFSITIKLKHVVQLPGVRGPRVHLRGVPGPAPRLSFSSGLHLSVSGQLPF
jgi:hypothetical protein